MLAGLKEGQAKMSKSDPDSAIFVDDDAKAQGDGGDAVFTSYAELERAFVEGGLHPADLNAASPGGCGGSTCT
jgi:tryptophanyl-tRNA synthetase